MAGEQLMLDDEAWASSVVLHKRPRATNELSAGQWPHPRSEALQMRYIEHSPHALLGAIVIDCDEPDAAMRALERPADHPVPNWIAQAPTGRAHIGFWLGPNRVCRTDSARMAPLRYAHRIERGLVRSIGGDFAYGGQLTKNPIHADWETIYGPARPYTLGELHTVHTPRQIPRKPDNSAGLGRNCAMFDDARHFAYGQWWAHRHDTADDWLRLIVQHCQDINHRFAAPLPFAEVRATAYSIGKWVWRNFTEDEYRARQSRLGQRGGIKGGAKGGRVVSPAKIEANRARRTLFDPDLALELSR